MKAMHAICHLKDGEPDNFRDIDPEAGRYGSGWWKIPVDVVASLEGGWLYLHDRSTLPSYFAARIEAVGEVRDGRYELIIRRQADIASQVWRGPKAGQNPAHYFRIVPADLPHEAAAD